MLLKIAILFLICTLFFMVTYFLFGEKTEFFFSQEKCIEWFSRIKPFAWIAGVLLLVSDILLPVPATGIMAALGAVYGVLPGAVISMAGSVSAGLIGYITAMGLGKMGSHWIASEQEIEKFKSFFDRWGGYAIIISRVMPMMSEVISILAGLSRMKFSRFLTALIAGSLPVSFLFSWIGAYSGSTPGAGILFAVLLPVLIWPFFIKLVKI